MRVEKKVGRFDVEVWTDGWPLWIKIQKGDERLTHLSPEDVTDLIYALHRVQAKIEPTLRRHEEVNAKA